MSRIGRARLPEHDRDAVTDEELRIADQVSDAEFRQRIGMSDLLPERVKQEDAAA